ncbi:MAG: hypothetical protein P8R42_14025, partial [Candidatus Binatia bacterium]|nr:hypothetical protein [Candidatus Binatia bacterium]
MKSDRDHRDAFVRAEGRVRRELELAVEPDHDARECKELHTIRREHGTTRRDPRFELEERRAAVGVLDPYLLGEAREGKDGLVVLIQNRRILGGISPDLDVAIGAPKHILDSGRGRYSVDGQLDLNECRNYRPLRTIGCMSFTPKPRGGRSCPMRSGRFAASCGSSSTQTRVETS